MATLAQGHHSSGGGGGNKITKARAKVVKPILKKLSHSEKNSLDLDRGWEDQRNYSWAAAAADDVHDTPGAPPGRSARDVSFGLGSASQDTFGVGGSGNGAGAGGGGGGSSNGAARRFHVRSTSGISSISVATNGSGSRGGSFVHPFQQTPRTATPPLSYANSLASFDNSRDYSPTITEDGDDEGILAIGGGLGPTLSGLNGTGGSGSGSGAASINLGSGAAIAAGGGGGGVVGGGVDLHNIQNSSSSLSHHIHQHPLSQSNLRRPSLVSQRTSSFSDNNTTSPLSQLRLNTNNSSTRPSTSSKLARGTVATSHSDLALHLTYESPISTTAPPGAASTTAVVGQSSHSVALGSPISSSSTAPMSPLRGSLDGFPRLRSRSELDTANRVEQVRAARRKFEERERAKDEKWDREQIRQRERRDTKEATRIEKEAATQMRKGSFGAAASESFIARPSASRKSTPPTGKTTPPTFAPSSQSHGNGGAGGGSGGGGNKISKSFGGTSFGLGRAHTKSDPLPSGVGMGNINNGSSVPGSARASSTFARQASASASAANLNLSGVESEKELGFMSKNYESTVPGQAPLPQRGVDDVHFTQGQRQRNRSGTKRKTLGYWHGVLLWVRTKLLRLGNR